MIGRRFFYFIVMLSACCLLGGCRHRHYVNQVADDGVEDSRYDSDEYKDVRKIRQGTKVRMEANGGVYLVPINVNGLDLKLDRKSVV